MRFSLHFKEAFLICFLLTTSCGGGSSGPSSTSVTSSPTENPPVTSSPTDNPPVTPQLATDDPVVTPQPPDDPVETPPPNPPLSTATVPSPPREVIGQSLRSYQRIRIRWEKPLMTDGDDRHYRVYNTPIYRLNHAQVTPSVRLPTRRRQGLRR